MLADPLDQRIALPTDAPGNAQPCARAFGPSQLEGIEQVGVVLARLDGADHQVHRVFVLEHLLEGRLHRQRVVAQVQLAAQVKMVEPALRHLLGPDTAQHLIAYLIGNGRGNRHVTVGGLRDPVEPVVEHPDQSGVAELRVGQRDQVIDHRDNAHAIALELFGQGEKIGVPGRVQEHQLITRLMLQGLAAGGDFLAPEAVIEQPDRHAQRGKCRQPAADIQHSASEPGLAKRRAPLQRAVHQPEPVGDLLQPYAHTHQVQLGHLQWRQAGHLVQRALEHHHGNAFDRRVVFWQLGNDVTHHALDPRVGFRVFEHIGAFNQQSCHGTISGACGCPEVSDERVMLVCASSHEQPTKSS